MPEACFKKQDDPFKASLKSFMCSVCEPNPSYIVEKQPSDPAGSRTVTLYLCEDFAVKLFTRSNDKYSSFSDLTKPPQAFDDCGYLYLSE